MGHWCNTGVTLVGHPDVTLVGQLDVTQPGTSETEIHTQKYTNIQIYSGGTQQGTTGTPVITIH